MANKLVKFKSSNYLIIPFGCPKWDIGKLKVVGVSPEATYFESEVPCAYIDKMEKVALRLTDFRDVYPSEFPDIDNNEEAIDYIRECLRERCDPQDGLEKKFLNKYFVYCRNKLELVRSTDIEKRGSLVYTIINATDTLASGHAPWDSIRLFDVLLPLPQAHIYVNNPMEPEQYSYEGVPKSMCKIDFAFWTGEQIIAVEIDSPRKITKDLIPRRRMLEEAGIKVINILHTEIEQLDDPRVMEGLLPKSMHFARIDNLGRKKKPHNPFSRKKKPHNLFLGLNTII
jgi:hypothetical protein